MFTYEMRIDGKVVGQFVDHIAKTTFAFYSEWMNKLEHVRLEQTGDMSFDLISRFDNTVIAHYSWTKVDGV